MLKKYFLAAVLLLASIFASMPTFAAGSWAWGGRWGLVYGSAESACESYAPGWSQFLFLKPFGSLEIARECWISGESPGYGNNVMLQTIYIRCTVDGRTYTLNSRCDGPRSVGPTYASIQPVKSLGAAGPTCPNPFKGNPCNASNGNKFQTETDYAGSVLNFTRSYNSLDDRKTELGYGWSSPYHRGVEKVGDFLVVRGGDGKGQVVEKIGGVWTADADAPFTLVQTASGFAITYDNGRVEAYNADGKLLSETSKSSQVTSYTYTSGKLTSVTHPYGHTLNFTYNTNGLLTGVTDPAGQSTSYAYDGNDNLVGVTYADGTSKTYHYESTSFKHHLTGITDENGGRYATYGYNAAGKAILSEHAGGQGRYTFAYTSDSQTKAIDASGTVETLTFSKNLGIKNLVQVLNQSDGKSVHQSFDANNNLVSRTDAEGRMTIHAYNAHNQRTSTTKAAGTAESRTTYYQYLLPDLDLPTLVTSPSIVAGQNKTTSTAYTNNLPTTITQNGYRPDGSAISRAVTMTYTATGQVATIDGPRFDSSDATTLSYNECSNGQGCGQLASVSNALGQTTTYDSYDAHGRVTQVTSANGLVTTYVYDLRGRILTTTQSDGTGSRTTTYTYDSAGQIKTATDASGRVLTYVYNAAHELTQITDNLGNKVSYAYDTRGNRTTSLTKDPNGSLVRSIDTSFDARNRAVQVNNGGSITQQVFDAAGNLINEIDPNANPSTTHTSDALDRLLQTVDRIGGSTQYQYDVADRLKQVIAPNGATTGYVYDDLGNLLSEVSPDRGTSTMTYDAAGNLSSRSDARGITATLNYDALNRVTIVDYPGSDDDIAYAYDSCDNGVGRVCQITDASGVTQYKYTGFGNTAAHQWTTGGQTYTTQYAFDAANRIISTTYPDGRVVNTTRDVLGRVINVALVQNGNTQSLISARSYRADGLLAGQTFGNGLAETRTYDVQGRLTQRTVGIDSTVYQYDANGNVLGQLGSHQNSSFGYDALDRLTSDQWISAVVNQALNIAYDANGNRISLTDNGDIQPYNYVAASNRIATINGNSVVLDAIGNTLIDNNGQRRFEYNATGRLLSLYVDGKQRASYKYNAQGLRTHKYTNLGEGSSLNTSTTVYHYDLAGQLIAETSQQGETQKSYVWTNGVPLAQTSTQGHQGVGLAKGKGKQTNWLQQTTTQVTTYLHTDHLGTPRSATDSTGQPVWQWHGNAFGDTAPEHADPSFIALRFPGQYYDAESGLHYNWNRYYDPQTGRYITSDPIGLQGGINTYGYAYANPVVNKDPYGLFSMGACGSGLIQEFIIVDGEFGPACSNHDKCYSTCGVDKWVCDNRFLFDMRNACRGLPTSMGRIGCLNRARAAYEAVSTKGQGPYERAQEAACKGCSKGSK